MAQRLKHLPAMWETWVRSLGQEDPLEKEMATPSSILAWEIPWTRSLAGYSPRVAKNRIRLSDKKKKKEKGKSGRVYTPRLDRRVQERKTTRCGASLVAQ